MVGEHGISLDEDAFETGKNKAAVNPTVHISFLITHSLVV